MPAKVSEKKLFFSVILLFISIALMLYICLFAVPGRLAQKEIWVLLIALVLFLIAIFTFKRAVIKI